MTDDKTPICKKLSKKFLLRLCWKAPRLASVSLVQKEHAYPEKTGAIHKRQPFLWLFVDKAGAPGYNKAVFKRE